MNPALFCLRKKTITLVLLILIIFMGIKSYKNLGRLEYPDFVIKIVTISTPYPGATPREVEEEVTNLLEETFQSMGEVKEIKSNSMEGLSVIQAEMLPTYSSEELPQIWDKVRKKINDVRSLLPSGAGPSVINDDFGDVYGIYYALTCTDSSLSEKEQLRWLKEKGRWLKKELLNIQDVRDIAKIDFWGIQQEVIYLEIPQSRLVHTGISPSRIISTLSAQNLVLSSGKVRIGDDYVRITPTGEFRSEDNILDIVISDSLGNSVLTLRDLVDTDSIQREILDPPTRMFRYNGKPAIALGVSTKPGGNVVFMGKDLDKKIATLKTSQWPEHLELGVIADQAKTVTAAVDTFTVNLYESLGIVVVLLMLFMGIYSGLLIGFILLLTILGTFIFMYYFGITLQIISLGALILALGMLVDNAIVVVEGILIEMQRGQSREDAAVNTVEKTIWPLLGATFIAILAFAAIGFAPDNIGEFCNSLFWVLCFSLMLSWLFAVTILPVLCVLIMPEPKSLMGDPYDKPFYQAYRCLIHRLIKYWPVTLGSVLFMTVCTGVGFRFIPEAFFGGSIRPQFFIDYWRAEGTHINVTSEDCKKIEDYLLKMPGVLNTSTFIGAGSLRYILAYESRDPDSCFAQILITVDDYKKIPDMQKHLGMWMAENFPNAAPQVRQIPTGPPVSYAIEAEITGPDHQILHKIANQVMAIFRKDPDTIELRDDWRQQVKVIRPKINENTSKRTGIDRQALNQAIQANMVGTVAGVYRDREDIIPIMWRLPECERSGIENLGEMQVYSSTMNRFIRLDQIVHNLDTQECTVWEDPIIRRLDRKPAMKVQCNSAGPVPSVLFERLRKQVENRVQMPPGYTLTWRGEYDAAMKGKEPLAKMFPTCLGMMFLICVGMFNAFRQPLVIFLTVPLAFIGVTAVLLPLQIPFGFMSILGFLGLSGMLIKNAIVLVDEIDLKRKSGTPDYKAVLDAAVSRMRPVVMASGTTVLGMAPLMMDVFYSGMAATVAGGLIAATCLTLVIVPIFYMFAFKITPDESYLCTARRENKLPERE